LVLTIVLGLFGLGIMVFFHELGHFLAAKAVGG
jgi:regulator of sigma E protease